MPRRPSTTPPRRDKVHSENRRRLPTRALLAGLAVAGIAAVVAITQPASGSGDASEGTAITIRARGNLGTENVDLTINGREVASWPVDKRYQTFATTVDGPIESIRVGHDSGWWPAAVIVDHVEIDGVRHESEDPSIHSRGAWDPVARCAPGFKTSEWISCSGGFFEYPPPETKPQPEPEPPAPSPEPPIPPTLPEPDPTPAPADPAPPVPEPEPEPEPQPEPEPEPEPQPDPEPEPDPEPDPEPVAPAPDNRIFEPIRNDRPDLRRYADTPMAGLPLGAPLLTAVDRPDNGGYSDGRSAAFRINCEYSHFAYDDPIIKPNQPGASHLHMFFGNTATNAFTTTDSLLNTGGGTCSGFELNRSGYWVPALLDGKGHAVVPDNIVVYYKTKDASGVQRLPQGLQLVAGNLTDGGFTADHFLHWSCGKSGFAYNLSNRIPDCGGDVINATIRFPSCWDGVNLSSPDHVSHVVHHPESRPCPGSHPVRLPDISILLYYPGTSSVDGWHLSSDAERGSGTAPGASLHADWWGGWHEGAQDLWFDGCIRRARNCSSGQTGTSRMLTKFNGLNLFQGDNFLPLPPGSYPR